VALVAFIKPIDFCYLSPKTGQSWLLENWQMVDQPHSRRLPDFEREQATEISELDLSDCSQPLKA
jgi:hypothetical protein